MIRVPLPDGQFAPVDKDDAERVARYRWSIKRASMGNYAMCRAIVNGKRSTIYMHRFIVGAEADQIVDHINGDKLDNRRCNLRVCSIQENNQNRASSKKGSSPYKGVRTRVFFFRT